VKPKQRKLTYGTIALAVLALSVLLANPLASQSRRVRRWATELSQEARIKAPNPKERTKEQFGSSVAVDFNTLIIGAPNEPARADSAAFGSGAAYVFTRGADGHWTRRAYLNASNADAGDRFGTSVALQGDVLAIGAPREASNATGIDGDQLDNSRPWAGAVYIFNRAQDGSWTQQAYLKGSRSDAASFFGGAVALDGDTLVVGAELEASQAGAVYVFNRTPDRAWRQAQVLSASNAEIGDLFGCAIALDGDTLAIGAKLEHSSAVGVNGDQNDNGAPQAGAVYVFERDASGQWQQQAYLKSSNTDPYDWFGASVDLHGDMLAVGAPFEASNATESNGDQRNNNASQSGAVYVFERDRSGAWSQHSYIKPSDTTENEFFGGTVVLNERRLAVGRMAKENLQATPLSLFTLNTYGKWVRRSALTPRRRSRTDLFGVSADLDADTLVVGAPQEDGYGAVYVYR
jgi:hypothetical protein